MIFNQQKINLIEGFAGIGAVHMSLTHNNIKVNKEKSLTIEWNVYSIIAYASLHYNEEYLREKEIISEMYNEECRNAEDKKRFTYKHLSKYVKTDDNGEEIITLSLDGKKPMNKLQLKKDVLINLISATRSMNHEADISTYSYNGQVGDIDLFWQSSPCQNFSLAGNGEGGDKDSGTSSSLLYEAVRLVEEMKPKVVIWENVATVLSDNHKKNFNNYIDTLSELGYTSSFKKLDGYMVGHPQKRTRVFVYSYLSEDDKLDLDDICNLQFEDVLLEDLIDFSVESYPSSDKANAQKRNFESAKEHLKSMGYNYKEHNFLFDAHLSPSRSASVTLGRAPTLLTSKRVAKYSKDMDKFTVLTAKEYWSLMGWNVAEYDLVENEVSEGQIYKICGNSIMRPQIDAIVKLGQIQTQEGLK